MGAFKLERWSVTSSSDDTDKTQPVLTQCGALTLLGGYGQLSSHKLSTALDLSPYTFTQLKLEATFHFLDAWTGHTAYLRLPHSGAYLWTDSHDFTINKNSLSVCGSEIGEGKFSVPLSIVFEPRLGLKEDGVLLI